MAKGSVHAASAHVEAASGIPHTKPVETLTASESSSPRSTQPAHDIRVHENGLAVLAAGRGDVSISVGFRELTRARLPSPVRSGLLVSVHRRDPSVAPLIPETAGYVRAPAWASTTALPVAAHRRRRARRRADLPAADALAALANRLAPYSGSKLQPRPAAMLTALLVRTVPGRTYHRFRPRGPQHRNRTRRPVPVRDPNFPEMTLF